MTNNFDAERVRKRITDTLIAVSNTDPETLAVYRKLFKKGVPLGKRSWYAAYVLMRQDASLSARSGRDHPRHEKTILSDEESVRLFFGAGRTRRIFPREILGLIISKSRANREDIGYIRILDNYSFVQVRSSVAQDIIDALNGRLFRGRPLTVNFARNRQEDESQAWNGESTTALEEEQGLEEVLEDDEDNMLAGDSAVEESVESLPEEILPEESIEDA
jgi:hypothetical protein